MKTHYSFMICKLKFMFKSRNLNIVPVTNLNIFITLKIFFNGSGDSKLRVFVGSQGRSLMSLCPNQI